MKGGRLIQQLPSLERGLNVIEADRDTVFHQLAVDHMLSNTGVAYWVDARNQTSTYLLRQLAPREEVVEDLRIARAFTAYQHHSIVRSLESKADGDTELILLPYLTSLYGDEEVEGRESCRLLDGSLSTLARLVELHDLYVLVSMPDCSDQKLRGKVLEKASRTIRAEETGPGTFYRSRGFRSKVVPVGGRMFQTTWSYWQDILGENREREQRFIERVMPAGTH